MRNYFFLLAAFVTLGASLPAHAGIAKDYVGCTSESALDELTTAMTRGDQLALRYLTLQSKQCISVGDLQFSLLKSGLMYSKARFYLDYGGSVVLWVPSEAVR